MFRVLYVNQQRQWKQTRVFKTKDEARTKAYSYLKRGLNVRLIEVDGS